MSQTAVVFWGALEQIVAFLHQNSPVPVCEALVAYMSANDCLNIWRQHPERSLSRHLAALANAKVLGRCWKSHFDLQMVASKALKHYLGQPFSQNKDAVLDETRQPLQPVRHLSLLPPPLRVKHCVVVASDLLLESQDLLLESQFPVDPITHGLQI